MTTFAALNVSTLSPFCSEARKDIHYPFLSSIVAIFRERTKGLHVNIAMMLNLNFDPFWISYENTSSVDSSVRTKCLKHILFHLLMKSIFNLHESRKCYIKLFCQQNNQVSISSNNINKIYPLTKLENSIFPQAKSKQISRQEAVARSSKI